MGRHSLALAERPSSRVVVTRSALRISTRVVSSLALGVCLMVTARGTLVADFGTFMTAYAIGLVAGLIAGIGAPVRVLRAPAESNPIAGTLFVVHTVLVGTVFVVLAAAYSAAGMRWAIGAGLLFALGDTLQNYAQAYLTAHDLHVSANLLVVAHRLAPLVAVGSCYLALGVVRFHWMAVGFVIPIVLGLAVPWAQARRSAWAPVGAVFRRWTGYWGYSGSAIVGQLQVPVLSVVATATTVGTFSMALRVVGPITLVTASITAIVVPELARRLGSPHSFAVLYRSVLTACAGYCAVVVALCWPGAVVVVALAGPQYHGAVALVAATIVGAGLSACSQGFNAKLLAVGTPGRATVAILAGGVLALGMLLVIGIAHATWALWTVPVVSQAVVLAAMVMVGSGGAR